MPVHRLPSQCLACVAIMLTSIGDVVQWLVHVPEAVHRLSVPASKLLRIAPVKTDYCFRTHGGPRVMRWRQGDAEGTEGMSLSCRVSSSVHVYKSFPLRVAPC